MVTQYQVDTSVDMRYEFVDPDDCQVMPQLVVSRLPEENTKMDSKTRMLQALADYAKAKRATFVRYELGNSLQITLADLKAHFGESENGYTAEQEAELLEIRTQAEIERIAAMNALPEITKLQVVLVETGMDGEDEDSHKSCSISWDQSNTAFHVVNYAEAVITDVPALQRFDGVHFTYKIKADGVVPTSPTVFLYMKAEGYDHWQEVWEMRQYDVTYERPRDKETGEIMCERGNCDGYVNPNEWMQKPFQAKAMFGHNLTVGYMEPKVDLKFEFRSGCDIVNNRMTCNNFWFQFQHIETCSNLNDEQGVVTSSTTPDPSADAGEHDPADDCWLKNDFVFDVNLIFCAENNSFVFT